VLKAANAFDTLFAIRARKEGILNKMHTAALLAEYGSPTVDFKIFRRGCSLWHLKGDYFLYIIL
jgi:hypothetical protein